LCSYSLQNATEGSSRNVSSIWKAKDQRSFVVTWKLDLILYFLAQIPIYVSCNGASSVYTSCKVVREHICGKIYIFGFGFIKKGLISLHREMEKGPSVQDSNGEENLSITDAP
jgi:uncharacterized BrkB/YihY/UPF0761 family membrane protein